MSAVYEFTLSSETYKKQKIYHLAAKDKNELLNHFASTKDPRAFYALMYFYGNAELFKNETKKAKIWKILN
jgi:hypothetical protein